MPATAAAVSVPDSVPPAGLVPIVIATVFVTVVARLPRASSMRTCTAGAIAAPDADAVGATPNESLAGAPGVPVCEKVTGDPASPAAVAVTVTGPGVAPKVCVTCAKPSESVNTVALLTEPPPAVTAKFTAIERTPSRSAAVTRTRSGSGRTELTMPLCPLPLTSEMIVATGCTVTRTVSACPVSVAAITLVTPRVVPPPSLPPNLSLIRTFAVSCDVQPTRVPGRGAPAVSVASAVRTIESPKVTAVSFTIAVSVLALRPGPL